jgi:hypothetical protein
MSALPSGGNSPSRNGRRARRTLYPDLSRLAKARLTERERQFYLSTWSAPFPPAADDVVGIPDQVNDKLLEDEGILGDGQGLETLEAMSWDSWTDLPLDQVLAAIAAADSRR